MPRWIYGSPPESAPSSEQAAAAILQDLPEDFSIRWQFDYRDHSSGIFREGDFVIQGPDGHLLVMEVKGGQPSCNPLTGRWTTADHENPFLQLDAEWGGVMDDVKAMADRLGMEKVPFIDRVLGLPDVELSEGRGSYEGVPRERVVARRDLENFSNWWKHQFGARKLLCPANEAQALFDGLFALNSTAGASSYTLDFADRVIERQTRCHFEILDALSENDQMIFDGGPGTGKTWFALEQAARWANVGMEVLLLCYNLELETWLKAVCPKRHKGIHIYSYQSLATSLLGKPLRTDFAESGEGTRYFDLELPRELALKVSEVGFQPPYDALVVDEAQDHNTEPSIEGLGATPGWWGLYLKLLKKNYEAPVAVFHDKAQRLMLRDGDFKPGSLCNFLSRPVSVRLRHPVRYTRQLRRFFESLTCAETKDLLRDMKGSGKILSEGPDPLLISDTLENEEGLRCSEIIRDWIEREIAKPQEIIVLYPSSLHVPAWLQQGKVNGVPFHLGTAGCRREEIAAVSINKAKGLERRAVVVVGLPDWSEASQNQYQARTFVQGVTRAQQLLAVITRPKIDLYP